MTAVEFELDRSRRSMVWLQRAVIGAVWLGAIVAWQVHQTSTGRTTVESAQQFIDTVGGAWWGVFAYLLVYLARPIVLFPASVLTVVGGILFGPVVGVLVVVVAANASAMVAYGVGRLLGRPPGGIESPGDDASLRHRWAGRMRANSFETVFVMRLIFVPYDLVNYLCGALRIRWSPFLAATALGSLPGTISFVLLGASLDRIDMGFDGIKPAAIVASVAIFVVSIIISRVATRRFQPEPEIS